MYRPEGWKNPYPEQDEPTYIPVDFVPMFNTFMHRMYERGADAMLERVKNPPYKKPKK